MGCKQDYLDAVASFVLLYWLNVSASWVTTSLTSSLWWLYFSYGQNRERIVLAVLKFHPSSQLPTYFFISSLGEIWEHDVSSILQNAF